MQVKPVWHQGDKSKSDISAVLQSMLVWIQVDMISLFMALNLYQNYSEGYFTKLQYSHSNCL